MPKPLRSYASPPIMRELPPDIDDAERIVRAVKTPYHVKKGKLKPAAFRPQPGQSIISVMRQLMGDDFCKDKAVEIAKASYVGLAVLAAYAIRAAGSEVHDAPNDFIGHAHIDHGFSSPLENEPPSPQETERMNTRYRSLADASTLHIDHSPTAPGWTGPPL